MLPSLIRKDLILFFLLIIIAFFSSYHFGFISINPIDNFTNYNSGFLVKKGNIPFKDYWVTTGPLLDFIQYFFFKFFGFSWNSYVFHSAFLNSFISCYLYYCLRKFSLKEELSFLYSASLAIIFYTQVGTPFVDHHSSIFTISAMLSFILALNFKKEIYWFLIPFFLVMGFLSKQTPAAYMAMLLALLIFYHFAIEKNYRKFITLSFYSILLILVVCLTIFLMEIEFLDFYYQYIIFASSVGEARINSDSFLTPINFSRYFLKFKWLHLSYFALLVVLLKLIYTNRLFWKSKDFISILLLIFSVYIFIIHQLLTLNVKFVYFLIPVICGFSHVYLNIFDFKGMKRIKILNLFILLISVTYYYSSYITKQKFVLFCHDNLKSEIVKTDIIDDKTVFKWISCLEEDPKVEIKKVSKIINFLNTSIDSQERYILITDYQFINSKLLNDNHFQINKWYHPGVSYPLSDNEKYDYFKNYVLKKIKLNNINSMIFAYPSQFQNENQQFFEEMFVNCISKKKELLDGIIHSLNIEKCY